MEKRPAYWTYEDHPVAGRAYYFAPTDAAPPPYRAQKRVTAILDIAEDGALAGVELVLDPLPPAPEMRRVTSEVLDRVFPDAPDDLFEESSTAPAAASPLPPTP